MNSFNDTKIKKIVNERFNDYFHRGAYFPMNEELNKGDIFTLNGLNPKSAAKMIAGKYGVSPDDFVPGKNGTIVYKPKRKSKVKEKVVSKPEGMSIEEYKEKYVIPMKPELDDIEGEEWRPVPNMGRYFGGDVDYGKYYEISNMGRLRTINLQNAAKSTISVGYDAPTRKAMQFHLNHKSGMNTCPDVKYMVADAFLGEHDLEDNMVIHIDGDYHNNRADNLKWVPRKKKSREMDINDIVTESIKRTLKENFSNRYTNAIKTIKHYLDIESETNHLSEEQLEQLSDVVNWLERHNGSAKWVKAGKQLLSKYSTAYSFGKNVDTFDTFPEDYEEDDIIYETVKRKLRESFETKYENAIDTVEYYLNMCADGHQLSNEQAEQLTGIVQWLKETDADDNPNTPEWIEASENLLNQYQQRQLDEKKSKSGIEINPENKGKFTATMKRTGKSAEELSHSKNPLTRKRAQFALNSKKWNKKKNANESTIGRIIREELENMSVDTDTQNARPKWMDILDAINAAGVNHAPKTTQQPQAAPKPESKPMQQQAQQTKPKTPQPKASANEYQIGKYTFNPYTHTLTSSNGSFRIRPQYSNILNALCQNMGEEVELAKMFGITDDRKMRVALSMMRKLFAEDPNVKIQYYGGKGKLFVEQEGLNESEETDEGNNYFGDFVDVLEECGWGYSNFQEVQNKSNGAIGTRFTLVKNNTKSCTAEDLKKRMLQVIPQQYVVFGNAQHRYAPEINYITVVLLNK